VHEPSPRSPRTFAPTCATSFAAGADGVFFALIGRHEIHHERGAVPGTGPPLRPPSAPGRRKRWLNTLHIHGDGDLLFETVLDYPVDASAGPTAWRGEPQRREGDHLEVPHGRLA
jgi:hypothetical protein